MDIKVKKLTGYRICGGKNYWHMEYSETCIKRTPLGPSLVSA